ncbi:MAG TPA: cystathionine beta-lyase [Casimicrobiaceae bacterium]|nr:cystathionine beta-lyase [Casimicrobiaceae bacterium]
MTNADDKCSLSHETLAVHLGRDPWRHIGAVSTPVYRASTILFQTMDELEAAQRGESREPAYGLHGLPTVTDLQSAIAALEGGYAALAVPSGLTATTMPLLALLEPGDHLLVTDAVYGPTRRFCELHLKRFGIDVEYYDPVVGADIAMLLKPTTRIVFCESPGSLTFEVQDVPAIAQAAHAHGVIVILDNTWATPIGFRSFDHGVDIAVHAVTKYIGGHSDLMLGVIITSESLHKPLHRLWTDIGVTASSDDCFLALRGLRTLPTRLHRHQASALEVAAFLRSRPEVRDVLYPALPGAQGHDLWQRDFRAAGGLFGVVLQPVGRDRIAAMLDGMRLFRMGWSWGGFESLMIPTWPERTRSATQWNPGGPCLRLQIGLESPADLIDDLRDGVDRLTA